MTLPETLAAVQRDGARSRRHPGAESAAPDFEAGQASEHERLEQAVRGCLISRVPLVLFRFEQRSYQGSPHSRRVAGQGRTDIHRGRRRCGCILLSDRDLDQIVSERLGSCRVRAPQALRPR
jgi:hypothetical protein